MWITVYVNRDISGQWKITEKKRTVIEKPTFGPIDLVNTELYMFKMCELCSAEKD